MNRSTGIWAVIGLAIALCVLAANAFVSYRNTRELGEKETWVRHTQQVITELAKLEAAALDAVTAQRGFLLSGDEKFLGPIAGARAEADQHLATLDALVADNAEQIGRLFLLKSILGDLQQDLDKSIAAKKAESLDVSKAKVDRVRQAVAQMQAEEQTLMAERMTYSRASYARALNTLLFATGIALLTVLLSAWLLIREARHQRSQARLAVYNRLLIDSTGEGIFGLDLDGNCTFLNTAGERILGRTAADVIGRNMHELTHHTHADGTPYPASECPIYRAFHTGVGGRSTDEVFWRADGTSFPVEYSAWPIKNEGVVEGAVVTFGDITERKQLDDQIRESAERFSNLADSIAQLAWMADGSGSIFWYNQRWFDFTGTTLDEMRGFGWQKVHHPDHVERVTEKFKEKVAAGEVWEDTFPLRGVDGKYSWFLSRAMPIRNASGRVVRYFGTNTDVTRQREIEEALRFSEEHLRHARDDAESAREQAEAANVAKSQFLANMSHELRTPLNAVIMYSELLQEEAEDLHVDTFIPDLEKIRGAGKHLLALINGVLDLSKIEAGRMDLYLETFDAAGMVRDVAATVQPLVLKNHNTLNLKLGDDLGMMHADLTKVRQILFNLLSNACKFTENGTVTVTARREEGQSPSIEFSVSDSGIGMSEEAVGKLFQPFTQADASTTRKYGGTGLGLAISKRFCEMMGGQITVNSTAGQGTTFTATLPAVAKKQEHPPEPADKAVTSATATVLVVDDDVTVRDVVTRALADDGIHVITAADGEEGLRLAHHRKPNLIFLDVMMPKMDGWAVLTALKADAELRDIPVVMLTIMNETEMGYMLGAAEYLSKPVDRDRLHNVLSKYRLAGGTSRVLIVEDDPTTRDVLSRSLVKQGWDVGQAANGREALERVGQHIPQLILLDLMMPEMNGFEFVSELRENPAWQQIPIVVLTSKDLTPQERNFLTHNVEKIVEKGAYSRSALLQEVRKTAASVIKTSGVLPDDNAHTIERSADETKS